MSERIEFYPISKDEKDKKLDKKFLDMEKLKNKNKETDLTADLEELSDGENQEKAA